MPELAALSVGDTAVAMQDWARRADAVVGDDPDSPQPKRSLHLSRILDGRRELSGSFDPEGGAVIATALRLAATTDVDGEPRRSPAQRRGDALVDVCRWFLDHQQHRHGGRHRPHLNIITTLHDLEHRGQGRLLDGSVLDAATLQRLCCDAGIHRVITNGRSSILDYGTTTRTIPANLFNALVIRDRHCRFPGCDRPPEWTEAHHIRWVLDGGANRAGQPHPAVHPPPPPPPHPRLARQTPPRRHPHRDRPQRPNTRQPAPQSATTSSTAGMKRVANLATQAPTFRQGR